MPRRAPSLLILDDDALACVTLPLGGSAACSLARTCRATLQLLRPKLVKMRDEAIAAFCLRHAPMRKEEDGSYTLMATSYLSICRYSPDEIALLGWLYRRDPKAAEAVKEVVFMSYPRVGLGYQKEGGVHGLAPATAEAAERALANFLPTVSDVVSFKAGTDAPLSPAVWRALASLPKLTKLEAECPGEKDAEVAAAAAAAGCAECPGAIASLVEACLLYTSPSPRDS